MVSKFSSPKLLITLVVMAVFFSPYFGSIISAEPLEINHYEVDIIQTVSHDDEAFTQGLLIHNGILYESTGLYNESTLREVNLTTGEVVNSIALNNNEFGEGLALYNGSLVQLTWKSEIAHIYDLETFTETGNFSYQGEGWGLCSNSANFVMSDGSSNLTIRSHDNFSVVDTIAVSYNGSPLDNLNELECIGDYVFANVWHWEWIFIINLSSGEVVGTIDAASIYPTPLTGGVLNGIAYDSDSETFWLTGKSWPIIHQVTWVPVMAEDNSTSDLPEEVIDGLGNQDDMLESSLMILISLLFAFAAFVLWGNGFGSLTRSRGVDNPPAATKYRGDRE